MLKKDLQTSHSAARHAVTRARETLAETVARCTMQFVQSAESLARFLLSHAVTARCTAATASEDNSDFQKRAP